MIPSWMLPRISYSWATFVGATVPLEGRRWRFRITHFQDTGASSRVH